MKTQCTKCKEYKENINFSILKSKKNNLNSWCKLCVNKYKTKYNKTEKGVINQIYNDQKKSSKERNHILPNYTKEELTTWMYNNNFKKLYNQWVNSNYDKKLKPSCDRHSEIELDYDNKPYCFTRLRLITATENYKKEQRCKTGKTAMRKINQYTKDNNFIQAFNSISEAGRKLNIDPTHIGKVCNGKLKTSGGYIWKYS